MFRFVHCADLHLGYKQYGLEEREEDFFNAFIQILDYCSKNKIGHLLIAGDLFHHKDLSPDVLHRTEEIIRNYFVKIYVISGNHDKKKRIYGMSWLKYLDNAGLVNLLSKEDEGEFSFPIHFPQDGVVIVGSDYHGASTAKAIKKLIEIADKDLHFQRPDIKHRIFMLHAGVIGFLPNAGNVNPQDIMPLSEYFDYIALGHIHKPYTIEAKIFNPGSPESCNIAEGAFVGGFFDVTFDSNIKKVNFVPTNKRHIARVSTNTITEEGVILTNDDVSIIKAGKKPIVEVTLKGVTEKKPQTKMIEAIIKENFDALVARIIDKTSRPSKSHGELVSTKIEDLKSEILTAITDDQDLTNLILDVIHDREDDPEVLYGKFEKFYKGEN